MESIDFKSLLIGILGTALVMVLMGQSSQKIEYDIECFQRLDTIQCKRFKLNTPAWDFTEKSSGTAMWGWLDIAENSGTF